MNESQIIIKVNYVSLGCFMDIIIKFRSSKCVTKYFSYFVIHLKFLSTEMKLHHRLFIASGGEGTHLLLSLNLRDFWAGFNNEKLLKVPLGNV